MLFSKKKKKVAETPVRRTLSRRTALAPQRLRRSEKPKPVDPVTRHSQLQRWLAGVLVGAFVLTVGYVFVWSPYVVVSNIRIEGATDDILSHAQAIVDEDLHQRTNFFIPPQSFFFVPRERIQRRLMQEILEVQAVQREQYFPHSLTFVLTTQDRFVVICSGGPCWVVDREGRVRGSEDRLLPSTARVRVIDMSGVPVEGGEPIVTPEFVSLALALPESIREHIGVETTGDMWTTSRLSGVVGVTTSEGWQLLLDSHADSAKTWDNLQLFFTKQIRTPAERQQLSTVDARTDNRIYYRLIGESNNH